MTTRSPTSDPVTTAATVAPEDLRCGDFVAVLSEVHEVPSFLWNDGLSTTSEPIVRVRLLRDDDRTPRKVEAICLPFVFVTKHDGSGETIDVRLTQLARIEEGYAKTVWKRLRRKEKAAGQGDASKKRKKRSK